MGINNKLKAGGITFVILLLAGLLLMLLLSTSVIHNITAIAIILLGSIIALYKIVLLTLDLK